MSIEGELCKLTLLVRRIQSFTSHNYISIFLNLYIPFFLKFFHTSYSIQILHRVGWVQSTTLGSFLVTEFSKEFGVPEILCSRQMIFTLSQLINASGYTCPLLREVLLRHHQSASGPLEAPSSTEFQYAELKRCRQLSFLWCYWSCMFALRVPDLVPAVTDSLPHWRLSDLAVLVPRTYEGWDLAYLLVFFQ